MILSVPLSVALSVVIPQSGTAAIRGRVVAADTGLPFQDAVVQIVSEETVRSGRARRTITDARGMYEVAGLQSGVYRLIVSPPDDKPMYLFTDRAADGSPAIIEVAADEVRHDLDFALPRAGAISGRITDQFGQPVAGADVRVLSRGPGGRLLTVPRAFAATVSDDNGRYRTWGFAAGTYLVRAEPRTARDRASPSREGYVRTYYPSATNPSDASAVRLRLSEDLDNIDIRLDLTRTFRLSGVVLDARGSPAPQAAVRLDFAGERATGAGQSRTTDGDGAFMFDRLAPGDYVLRASHGTAPQRRLFSPMASSPMRIGITGADVDNISLPMRFGRPLGGGLVTEDGGVPPFDFHAIRVKALAADAEDQGLAPRGPGSVDGRARFRVQGVLVPVILRLEGLPQGWFLAAVMQGADDVIDTPADVFSGRSDLRVIVSNRGATVAGSVEDGAGRAVALRDVHLFPDIADIPESWASGLHRALTDRQGRFQVDGIAPGRYLVLAADRPIPQPLDQEAWTTIRESATPVAVGEQGRQDLRLRLAAWPY